MAIEPATTVDITDLFDFNQVIDSTNLQTAIDNADVILEYNGERLFNTNELTFILDGVSVPSWTYDSRLDATIDTAIVQIDMPKGEFVLPYDSLLHSVYTRADFATDFFRLSFFKSVDNGATWVNVLDTGSEGNPEKTFFSPIALDAGDLIKATLITDGVSTVTNPSVTLVGRQRRLT